MTAPPTADLWILRRNGRDRLTYRVQLRREDGTHDTAMPVYFIDAYTRGKAWAFDNIHTDNCSSLYSRSVTINT